MDDSQLALIRHPNAAHCVHASLPSGRRPTLLASRINASMNDKISSVTSYRNEERSGGKREIVRRSGMSMLCPGKCSYTRG
jgi:hypothetical protein